MDNFFLLIICLLIIILWAIGCFHYYIHKCIITTLMDDREIPVVDAEIVENVFEEDLPVVEIVIDEN